MVYLDYAATALNVRFPCSNYGPFLNVNANYTYGEKSVLRQQEEKIKKAIGAKSGRVIFGGTASQLIENLMTYIDEIHKKIPKKSYLPLVSEYEHDSFWRYSKDYKYTFTNLSDLQTMLCSTMYDGIYTSLVMWQGVNNVTGQLFPIEEIGGLTHKYDGYFICDMTAMLGKAKIPANIDQWCDCAIWSGHKIGTELGIGCMWISDVFDRWLNGFILHGTPNLAGACAIADATAYAYDYDNFKKNNDNWYDLVCELVTDLEEEKIDYNIIHDEGQNINAILAIKLPGINADALQQFLATKQIYISIGASACAEKHDYRVLRQGYSLSNKSASEVIRISFGEESSKNDIVELVNGIKQFKEKYCKGE